MVFGFRQQAFVTRAYTAGLSGVGSEQTRVQAIHDGVGTKRRTGRRHRLGADFEPQDCAAAPVATTCSLGVQEICKPVVTPPRSCRICWRRGWRLPWRIPRFQKTPADSCLS